MKKKRRLLKINFLLAGMLLLSNPLRPKATDEKFAQSKHFEPQQTTQTLRGPPPLLSSSSWVWCLKSPAAAY